MVQLNYVSDSMRRKILRKLSRYIDKLYRKEHLKVHKNDIKCTNCNEWYSISGINHKHHIEDTEFGVKTSCGQCGNTSYWNLEIAPVAILCNDSGIPLNN